MFDTIKRELARRDLLKFIGWTWAKPNESYIVGYHTQKISQIIHKAIDNYFKGISSYICIEIPFRHGKSEICSRYLPPYLFGLNPDLEIVLGTYGQSLSDEMSRDAREIVGRESYQQLFPMTKIDFRSRALNRWGIWRHRGKFVPVGFGGAVTGKGADILIIDDFLKSRKDAESATVRETVWHSFTNDFLTRIAPVHIVLILANRWHVDDLIGRIQKAMKEEDMFPQFEFVNFKAKSDEYPSGYLFPERYPPEWYELHFASLGSYAAAGLMQNEPTIRGGNMFKMENLDMIELDKCPDDIRFVRFWDLASTEKERNKEDPDYSVGSLIGVKQINGLSHCWLKDVKRIQSEAPERDRLIKKTAAEDGSGVIIGIESVAGYKDTFTRIKKELAGKAIVQKVNVTADKVVRAGETIEPVIEAGNFHVVKSFWNEKWREEMQAFPNAVHDDQVDSATGGFAMARKLARGSSLIMAT